MWAITLWQPWASMIADGMKTIETRGWAPPGKVMGQRIAIHAGRKMVVPEARLWGLENEPTGCIVATARLVCAHKVLKPPVAKGVWVSLAHDHGNTIPVDRFGDFGEGRWLWMLADVEKLPEPVPIKGGQAFWEWKG